jgi:hypothetical protein
MGDTRMHRMWFRTSGEVKERVVCPLNGMLTTVQSWDSHDRLRSQRPIETGGKREIHDSSSPSELESRGYARGDDSGLWTRTQSAATTELVAGITYRTQIARPVTFPEQSSVLKK